ncbi:exopolysaccharide biosynthesis polyprenyl glycosylphosphotransferase [Aneurinibacillus soli]|uniref:UDP-N-acetylgalactosamine-undecaprenyl-phosphate N-acetylgalactosaminephosphotransferase n=1 Tax=Aneurinibacillus soli TaxID=1500254 RepID=A0A0U5ART0_9BACL|nr:sugar transferase [Aneurinibacillus soli]PYE61523.1 exopolysaccharide biosynthesis polyprenyl glycosylphosphotransferase [Aneurinibacillus soli]BAU26522.1 UDP-N-acetylgalactosamine-undecaprenyl-phosphate N-acetylgalactosaminephosphotransferase [Aneurinibacillus soli]
MGRNIFVKLSKVLFACFDLLVVNIGIILAFRVKFGGNIPLYNWRSYESVCIELSLVSLVVFYMFDLYSNWRRKSLYNLVYAIVLSIGTLSLITMILTFWYRGFSFPRSVIVLTFFIQVILFIGIRSFVWWAAKRKYGRRSVLIIDHTKEQAALFAQKFHQHIEGWFVIHDRLEAACWKERTDLIHDVDVVLLSPLLSREERAEILSYCARYGKEVLLVPELFELFILNAEPQQIDDMLVLSVQPPGLSVAQLFGKRVFDIIVSLTLLIILSPVILILFILVPATSRGPAIFKQERMGRHGKEYRIYKFRSMVQDAEKYTGPMLAVDKDPRITPVGHFIRATRLDEIPQLWNVLKGEMSLIGPRPERAVFIEQFSEALPDYAYRMSVKPGITGLAQIMARYNTTVEDKLRFDLMYVQNYSLALDIKVLLQTIRVVFQWEKARGMPQQEESEKQKTVGG